MYIYAYKILNYWGFGLNHRPDSNNYKKKEQTRWIKSETPVIQCVIHHRQNPIQSTYKILLILLATVEIEDGLFKTRIVHYPLRSRGFQMPRSEHNNCYS
jgi:hypothetical protein